MLFLLALACAPCHQTLVEDWQRTPMARSSGVVDPTAEKPGQFTHAPSQTHYRVFRAGDFLLLTFAKTSLPLDFFIGSRRMGRSFVFQREGHLYQAPVGFYANRNLWDMPPGYERDTTPDLSRPITPDCLFCHASPTAVAEINRLTDPSAIHGIQCARCHGAKDDHGQLLNPAKLPPRQQASICEQCHLSGEARIPKPNKHLADFQPGQDLADYVEVLIRPRSALTVRVNGHADALASAKCRNLTCLTCHNPHKPAQAVAPICQSCHKQPHTTDNCAPCHMPKARATDGGHTVYTDHSIPRKPRPKSQPTAPDALISYFNRTPTPRDLGLAWSELAVTYTKPDLAERAWPLLREAAATQPKDPALYAQLGHLLEAAGHRPQAIQSYRLSLSQNPFQPQVLLRLAALLGATPEAQTLKTHAAALLP